MLFAGDSSGLIEVGLEWRDNLSCAHPRLVSSFDSHCGSPDRPHRCPQALWGQCHPLEPRFFSYFLSIVSPELASTYREEDKNTK